ncbi:kinase-like domain-containing protein [Rhizophagus clarus]|uniref:Kinase-like domain-containing protein n=1 Tax=Rhizophagus clarus TaxID=94130 RepID=A0A8H3LNL3_9GLOM|nr:kinase-like domain-containing protein [Rhizophagus clarus]
MIGGFANTVEHIKYYEYSEFENIQRIGKGSFGEVYRINWKNSDRFFFALKFFNNDVLTLKEVVKELQSHRRVLEYATGGTLDTYLNDHFNELNWSDKFHLAWQLANAVEYGIVHRDLNIKLAICKL